MAREAANIRPRTANQIYIMDLMYTHHDTQKNLECTERVSHFQLSLSNEGKIHILAGRWTNTTEISELKPSSLPRKSCHFHRGNFIP